MPPTLSPSSLSVFKSCPRCFWLQINKGIYPPSGIFPSLPSGMDKILKSHFDSYRGKSLPPELSSLKEEILFPDKPLLDDWRNWRKGLKWEHNSYTLTGAVDDILKKGEKLIVLDYKTRGFPIKEDTASYYQDQLDIYTLLLKKNGYQVEDYAYLIVYHPLRVERDGNVVFHRDLVKIKVSTKSAEKLFNDAIKTLEGPLPPPSKDCECCGWLEKVK